MKITSVCFTDQESLEESVAECTYCGIVYGDDDDSLWICCSNWMNAISAVEGPLV